MVKSSAFLGLLTRRERWGLSLRGCLTFCLLSISLLGLLVFAAYPFLAISSPVPADTLVVEGWLDPAGIRAAALEAKSRSCQRVFATGGPRKGTGPFTTEFNTVAHAAYTSLLAEGISPEILVKVPCHVRDRNRTYSSGLALRDWFLSHKYHPECINVVSESVHARRTRLLFQKALGPEVRVGIICIPSDEYPPKEWWKYSEGVKDVISEGAAYLYARFFFWP